VQGPPCRGLGELAEGKIKSPKTFFLAFCMPPQAAQEGKEVFGGTPDLFTGRFWLKEPGERDDREKTSNIPVEAGKRAEKEEEIVCLRLL
jgi:hypothetical protein